MKLMRKVITPFSLRLYRPFLSVHSLRSFFNPPIFPKKILEKIFGKFGYLSYMKKVIRLTESDLVKLVKRVIKEEDENEGSGISITIKDIFREVKDVLNDFGGYDESMREQAMDLSKEILGSFKDDLSEMLTNYVTDNYEESIIEILGDEY